MLASCMDCPSIINDKEVVFTLPIDDIGMLSHFPLLHISKKPHLSYHDFDITRPFKLQTIEHGLFLQGDLAKAA